MDDFPNQNMYLKTDPEVCEERIKKRARKGKNGSTRLSEVSSQLS